MIPVPVGKGSGRCTCGPYLDLELPVGRTELRGSCPVLPTSGVLVGSNGLRRDGISSSSRPLDAVG